jgi:hypothetical protein
MDPFQRGLQRVNRVNSEQRLRSLDDGGKGVRFPAETGDFSLTHSV